MPSLQEMLGVTTSPSGEVLPVTSTDDAMDRAYLGPVASEVGNSFLNRLALQTDERQKDMYTQIGVLGSVMENQFPDTSAALQEFSKKGVERNIRQIASKPQPTRSVGITDAFTDIKEDLKNCHALVTNYSLSAFDALLNYVPVFAEANSVMGPVTSRDISKIEKPLKPGRKTMEEWLKFVAENQFTLKEMADGTAYETLKYQNE